MAAFEGADILVVIGAIGAGVATVLGAWLTHRRPPAEEESRPDSARSIVRLHDEDRTLLAKVIDTIHRGVTRIEDALSEHRRALDDNSDHLKRNRKD